MLFWVITGLMSDEDDDDNDDDKTITLTVTRTMTYLTTISSVKIQHLLPVARCHEGISVSG